MSIGSWVALALVLAVATGYFFITQQGNEIAARQRSGVVNQEMSLTEAVGILWREAVGATRKLVVVQERYKHKPVRKHSAAYLGKNAVRVTTLQTIARRG